MGKRVNKIGTMHSGSISLIIPALNEEGQIAETLRAAGENRAGEIIVVDGGSRDETCSIAREFGCKVITSPPGRGVQMNAGAAIAGGDILLFLHADTKLPEEWDRFVKEAFEEGDVAGSAFRFSIEAASLPLYLITFAVNLRTALFSLPYGDQAIAVRKEIFSRLGGYPPLSIMEDVAMVRGMGRLGRLKIIKTPVKTSPRRWNKEGWFKVSLRNQALLFSYLAGVSPERLARFYRAVR